MQQTVPKQTQRKTEMPLSSLIHYAQQALFLSIAVAAPIVLVASVVGLVVAALQTSMQVHDPAISHLPRLLAVGLALACLGPWMGRQIASFAARVFLLG